MATQNFNIKSVCTWAFESELCALKWKQLESMKGKFARQQHIQAYAKRTAAHALCSSAIRQDGCVFRQLYTRILLRIWRRRAPQQFARRRGERFHVDRDLIDTKPRTIQLQFERR
jgi:hypothetical protein